jgi:hypothetical protein
MMPQRTCAWGVLLFWALFVRTADTYCIDHVLQRH